MNETMKEAQARCRQLKSIGTAEAIAEARAIEAGWKSHPSYESDAAFFLRSQAGR